MSTWNPCGRRYLFYVVVICLCPPECPSEKPIGKGSKIAPFFFCKGMTTVEEGKEEEEEEEEDAITVQMTLLLS